MNFSFAENASFAAVSEPVTGGAALLSDQSSFSEDSRTAAQSSGLYSVNRALDDVESIMGGLESDRIVLTNSGFENGLADWVGFTGQEEVSRSESFMGNSSLELSSANSGIVQFVERQAGATYRLSGYAKTLSDAHSDFGINFLDADYNLLERLESGAIDSASWQQYEVSGTAPVGTEFVQVWANHGGNDGSTFIDELELSTSGSEPPTVEIAPPIAQPEVTPVANPEVNLEINLAINRTNSQSLDIGTTEEVSVYLLGGQSNMVGLAPNSALSPELATPYSDVQIWQTDSQDFSDLRPGFADTSGNSDRFGPELAFGRDIEASAGEPVYLIKHARGSTSLAEDWNPSGDNNTQYDTFVDQVGEALGYLDSQNIDYDVEGMLWMQGEFDAFVPEYANAYEANLTALIADMRDRYGADMKFAIGRLHDPYATTVIEAQEAVAAADPLNVIVNTDDFEILPDGIHYSAAGQLDLGSGFASALN